MISTVQKNILKEITDKTKFIKFFVKELFFILINHLIKGI